MRSFAWSGFVLLAALCVASPSAARAQACPGGNLLAGAKVVSSVSPGGAATLIDGRLVPEGSFWNSPGAVRRQGPGAFAVFDLGRPTRIRSALLQGDSNDAYAVSVSSDGQQFQGVWVAPKVETAPFGLRLRVAAPFDAVGRYVRVDVVEGDGFASLTELQAFCGEKPPTPPLYQVVTAYRTDQSGSNYRMALATKAAICFAAIAAFFLFFRRPNRRRDWVVFAISTALAVHAFTDLAHVHGHGRVVHPSDAFHYYLGPKYFPELGYFDLYICVAQAEREGGRRAELARFYVRDLRTNRIRLSERWPETGPRCGGRFSEARWKAFRADLDGFRPFFSPGLPLQRLLADHGYNGTPITTAFHRLFVRDLPATHRSVLGMTLLDATSYLIAIGFIAWGLGPIAGILAGFVMAYGEPWGFQWVGGSIGRANFVLWLGVGLGLAGRNRFGASTAALTLSALFRLYPALFVGVAGLRAIFASVQARRLGKPERNVIVAAFATLVVGVALAALAVGVDAFFDWARVMHRHAANPPGNHLGLPIVLHFQPGVNSGALIDARLTNPLEVWETKMDELVFERRWLYVLGVVFAAGVFIEALRRGASHLQAIGFGGLLLFSVVAITNYDGFWVLTLLPLVYQNPRRIAALIGFLGVTQIVALMIINMEMRCFVQSILMYMMFVYVSLDALKDLGKKAEPSDRQLEPTAPI